MEKDPATSLDLIWGLEGIAQAIGRTVRQTHHMLSTGKIPAKQVGNRWVIERSKLVAFFLDPAA
ncbi:DNA-binding protein [Rhizobium lentis]|uniref:DNA-binding protein n=1 Tax=Rhizobium lentis TaxID=1138194 RepID=UPI001C8370A2|nr:DNA-binding protein [Rhizobium lentis]MBX5020182.1 DNA-binding protein [Rhizobium lentis]